MLALRVFEEEKHGKQRHAPEWEIDPEAPPPGRAIGQGAPQERSDDGGDAEHAGDEAEVHRPLLQRH